MASREKSAAGSGDFLKRPLSAIFWWGLPLIAGWSAELLPIKQVAETFVWAIALAWMGTGCALNARRCHRLHCMLAAPLLFLGAAGTALAGFGWTPLGPHTASDVTNGSLLIALLTFLAEPIWGKYGTR